MSSFLLLTSIQKRLLRYVLSKIDILDADALNVKNLDIAWGTKNVFEFRDTPMRLKVCDRNPSLLKHFKIWLMYIV